MTAPKILFLNLDKPHRCPGRSGSGFKYVQPHQETGCRGGHVHAYVNGQIQKNEMVQDFPWHVGKCDECGVLTWPYALRLVHPGWIRHVLWWKTRHFDRYDWKILKMDHAAKREAHRRVNNLKEEK